MTDVHAAIANGIVVLTPTASRARYAHGNATMAAPIVNFTANARVRLRNAAVLPAIVFGAPRTAGRIDPHATIQEGIIVLIRTAGDNHRRSGISLARVGVGIVVRSATARAAAFGHAGATVVIVNVTVRTFGRIRSVFRLNNFQLELFRGIDTRGVRRFHREEVSAYGIRAGALDDQFGLIVAEFAGEAFGEIEGLEIHGDRGVFFVRSEGDGRQVVFAFFRVGKITGG